MNGQNRVESGALEVVVLASGLNPVDIGGSNDVSQVPFRFEI